MYISKEKTIYNFKIILDRFRLGYIHKYLKLFTYFSNILFVIKKHENSIKDPNNFTKSLICSYNR